MHKSLSSIKAKEREENGDPSYLSTHLTTTGLPKEKTHAYRKTNHDWTRMNASKLMREKLIEKEIKVQFMR